MTRRRARRLVVAYGVALAAVTFLFCHEALLVQDGDVLMEMTRGAWLRHSFEIPNGLDVSDGLDLILHQTVKAGPHMYGKYPPIYPILAALPYALFGVRALYLLNAVGLAALVAIYHSLARTVVGPRLAFASAIALPVVVPLVPFVLTELPHLVSAAFVLGAVSFLVITCRESDGKRTLAYALAGGLLAGIAVGIRLQNVVPGGVLIALAFLRANRRWPAAIGYGLGLTLCVAFIGAVNVTRFGTFNPFTYGVNPLHGNTVVATENVRSYVEPTFVIAAAWPVVAVFLARRASPRRKVEVVAWVAALVGPLLFSGVRAHLVRMATTTFGFVINTTLLLPHCPPNVTFNWINKPLLAASPLLVIAFIGMFRCLVRSVPVVLEASAWISMMMFVFMSTRDPDPYSLDGAVVGFFSISPRYLVDVFPLLVLLGAFELRDVRLARFVPIVAWIAAAPLAYFFGYTRDDTDPRRAFLIVWVSIGLAFVVLALFLARRIRYATTVLSGAVALALAYSAVVVTAGDGGAFFDMGRIDEKWATTVESVTPQSFVLVGWENARDCIFVIRAHRDVVFVDAELDTPDSLRTTLARFAARHRPIYYFGYGMEFVRQTLEPYYAIVPVSIDPLLWRLDPH